MVVDVEFSGVKIMLIDKIVFSQGVGMHSLVHLNAGNEELLIAANDSNGLAIDGDSSVALNSKSLSRVTSVLPVATEFNSETYDINRKPTYPIFHY